MGGRSYIELQKEITDVCQRYGYRQCNRCPLVSACLIERKIEEGENQTEFTKRWESGMAEEFIKQFPEKV